VRGNISNTGHSVILKIDNSPFPEENEEENPDMPDERRLAKETNNNINRDEDPFRGTVALHKPVNITGGPLTYSYQVEEIHIHYGTREGIGSEHTINGYAFPAEVLTLFFDSLILVKYTETEYTYLILSIYL
jgi:hypothetical protein